MIDVAKVESPVTHQNIMQAFDFMMGVRVVSQLLAHQDESGADIDMDRLKDLGKLLFFLTEQPSNVLGELSAEERSGETTQ